MLSSAHVLAMDAKNLLDVVDSLRKRYPDLFVNKDQPPVSNATVPDGPPQQPYQPASRFQFDAHTPQPPQPVTLRAPSAIDENYQVMTRQSYQNVDHSPSNSSTELYSNQPMLSPQPQCGIYDNECIINQQQQSTDVDDAERFAQQRTPPPKPPVAAKPSNLQQKLKRGQLPLPKDMSAGDAHGLDEPLRIVEDEMVCERPDDDTQLYSNTMVQLPEPVSCSIVQENIKKLSVASSHIKG